MTILQHNVKKIRNNIQKSNASGKPRLLNVNGHNIAWKKFKGAYNWDQSSHSLPLHEGLTPQHFELDSASKMKNHLAEDVLDRKMLFLMEVRFSWLIKTWIMWPVYFTYGVLLAMQWYCLYPSSSVSTGSRLATLAESLLLVILSTTGLPLEKKCHWHTRKFTLTGSVWKSYWIIRAKIFVTFHVAHFSDSYESNVPCWYHGLYTKCIQPSSTLVIQKVYFWCIHFA